MKKILLLYLFCHSFSVIVLAQTKETIQTKNTKRSTTLSQKQTNPIGKNKQKPNSTIQAKDPKGTSKNNDVKKTTQKNILPIPISKQDSISQKNTLSKPEDNTNNTKVNNKQGTDTNKLSKITIPISVDSAHNKNASSVNQKESSSFNFLSILSYGIIVVLIGLFMIVFTRYIKKIDTLKSKLKQNDHESSYQIAILREEIKKAEIEKSNLIQQEQELREELRIERKNNQVKTIFQQTSQPILQQGIVQTQKPENLTKYARYADQGDGFTVSDLLSEENNDTIFEITITSLNTATFKVTNNLNAQKYALSNAAYFLGKTCKYDSTPSQNSIIRTDDEGELKLQGGNKWLILNLAKISFI